MSKTQKDFQRWAEAYMLDTLETLKKKGDQYAPTDTYALENFRQAAAIWKSTESAQILQYATKHWVFLTDVARLHPEWTKPLPDTQRKVEESAKDIIIYMLLLIYGQLSDNADKMGTVGPDTKILRG